MTDLYHPINFERDIRDPLFSALADDDSFVDSVAASIFAEHPELTELYPVRRTLIPNRTGLLVPANVAGTYVFAPGLSSSGPAVVLTSSGVSGSAPIYFDPADYAVSGKTTKLRIRGTIQTNAVAPAANFSFRLCPVSVFGGVSGSNPVVVGVGTALESAAINAPGASTQSHVETAEFDAPTAGWFVPVLVTSAAPATNSTVMAGFELTLRHT